MTDSIKKTQGVDIVDFAGQLWQRKWIGAAIILICAAVATLYLRSATYKYTAEVAVTPASQGGPQVPSGLSNLGSLVGVDLKGEQGSSFSLFPEAAKSITVANRLSNDQKIMRTIFAAAWDEQAGKWREPASSTKWLRQGVKGILGAPTNPWAPPDARQLREVISIAVAIEEDDKKDIVRIRYSHPDPAFASYFLGRLNAETDAFLREKSLRRSSSYIDYLERRLATVQVAEYRESLSSVLSTYEKTRMMASSDVSFAADTFGGVVVSSTPTSPKPVLVVGLSILLGLAIWLAITLAELLLRRDRRVAAE